MNSEDEDFEREMMEYSEIETIPKDQFEVTLPRTIRQYQQRIQSNNSTSIFDADYTLEGPSKNPASETIKKANNKFDQDFGVFKDDKVTYVVSGRGRGGRNIVVTNGESNINKVLNGDEEIRQQLRKVAPIGYSNEITERAVRDHKMAKVREQDANANVSPTVSKSSSPDISKANSISPASSKTKTNLNIDSPVLSGKSTPCSTTSDVASSDYLTSQDHMSPSSTKSNQNESSEVSTITANKFQPSCEVNTGAIPKKPQPLSELLKPHREARRQRQLKCNEGLSNGYTKENYENELASHRVIEELLRKDCLEEDMRKKRLSDKSSNSSVSSREEVLPWRQRNNSPPRHTWGQIEKRKLKPLNINSTEDFPAL